MPTPSSKRIIRLLDVLLAGFALIMLSPLMLLAALAIRVTMGSPVLFRQERAGYHNRTFRILKFRTMRDANDARGTPLSDQERLTPLGRFLRKSSLDETPELINVIRGDMSLVGPRPLYPRYYPYYTDRERLRFEVLPGITGLAQISGRNFIDWDRKLGFDVFFVEHYSVWFYLKILFLTPLTVIDWRHVSADPYAAEQALDVARSASRGPDGPATWQ